MNLVWNVRASQVNVMVTAGANQAFANIVLTLCDAADPVVFFLPTYFNHLMAVQMAGGSAQVSGAMPCQCAPMLPCHAC